MGRLGELLGVFPREHRGRERSWKLYFNHYEECLDQGPLTEPSLKCFLLHTQGWLGRGLRVRARLRSHREMLLLSNWQAQELRIGIQSKVIPPLPYSEKQRPSLGKLEFLARQEELGGVLAQGGTTNIHGQV